jgi:hypothetical protein
MTYEQFELEGFVAKVRSRADDVIDPGMTVAEMDMALRELAISIIAERGGAAFLLSVYPPLTSITVDLKDFRYSPASGNDVVSEIAVQGLVATMEPVRNANLILFFEDGIAAATERLLEFVVNAHPHARGVISVDSADVLGQCLADIGRAEVAQSDLADAIMVCERALRLLSIPPGGRVTDALGGREAILAQKDVAEKLLVSGSIDGFYSSFMVELAARDEAQAPAR